MASKSQNIIFCGRDWERNKQQPVMRSVVSNSCQSSILLLGKKTKAQFNTFV